MNSSKQGVPRAFVELVSVGAVVLGLIFVGLELRQNTNAVRSGAIQDIIRWSYDGNLLMLEYPELEQALSASCDATQEQRHLLDNLYGAALRIQLNRFHQTRLGIVDEDLALSLGGRSPLYENPVFTNIWEENRTRYASDFQEFVDSQILPFAQGACAW